MPKTAAKSKVQKTAEAEVDSFRKDLGPFVVAAETTRMPMLFTNAKAPDNPIIFANDAFLKLTGYRRDEVLGQGFNALLALGVDGQTMAQVKAAVGGQSVDDLVIHYRRKDGDEFWAGVLISPVRDAGGALVQHFVSLVDLTRHMAGAAHSEMMIHELNHRVKNTLSTVQSIVQQALRRSTDPATIREAIESRLFALSRAHDLLSRENWEGAGLLDLVRAVLKPFGVADGGVERLRITGEDLRLTPKATLALGIALHELATNAVKYGSLSNETGSVALNWELAPGPDGDRLRLNWRENNGPPVKPPTHKGFGSQVLERGLAHELEGEVRLDYAPGGLVCTIDVPAPLAPPRG